MSLHADEITPEMYGRAQSKIATQAAQIEALQRALSYLLDASEGASKFIPGTSSAEEWDRRFNDARTDAESALAAVGEKK